MLFTKVSKFISREYSVYHMTTEVLSWTWLDHNCATGEVKPHHTRKYSPLHTGYLSNQGKHPASQAGVCVKIAGCGAAGSHFRAIFAHRHGARLPMDLLMGPGRSTEDWSSCYKLSASSGDGIVIKSYLWVFSGQNSTSDTFRGKKEREVNSWNYLCQNWNQMIIDNMLFSLTLHYRKTTLFYTDLSVTLSMV